MDHFPLVMHVILYYFDFYFRLNCLILNDNGIESIELGNEVQGLFQFYTSLHLLLLLLFLPLIINFIESDLKKLSFLPVNLYY